MLTSQSQVNHVIRGKVSERIRNPRYSPALNFSLKKTLFLRRLCTNAGELQNFFHRRALVAEFVKKIFAEQAIIPHPSSALVWRQFVHALAPCDSGNFLSYYVRMNQLILRLRFSKPDTRSRADKKIRVIKTRQSIFADITQAHEKMLLLVHLAKCFRR